MGSKMSNIHDGDEKIPTPSTLGRIRVKMRSVKHMNLMKQQCLTVKLSLS